MELLTRITQGWCRETSADPTNWSMLRPSHGQCAITAALIHEALDIPMIRGWALVGGSRISHYWNQDIDLTAGQFPDTTTFEQRPGIQGQDAYDYIVSNPETVQRLNLLRTRIR